MADDEGKKGLTPIVRGGAGKRKKAGTKKRAGTKKAGRKK